MISCNNNSLELTTIRITAGAESREERETDMQETVITLIFTDSALLEVIKTLGLCESKLSHWYLFYR